MVERIEGHLQSEAQTRFGLDNYRLKHDLHRAGALVRSLADLNPEELIGPEELANEKV